MMFRRWASQLLAILYILTFSVAINKSVYKIILNSKGYAQFLQYDLDMPPMKEFTLCAWVRVTSLETDQTIFTYISNDDKRIMRVWLDSGGQQMRISLDHGRVLSTVRVQFTAGVWRDVCVSYQADYAAWALYLDAQLQLCDGSSKVQGYEFPGEGRLIFGYGTSEKGSPTGLTGEIYGVTMILYSTIERNITLINELWKRPSRKNKTANKYKHENNYIIIGDLQTDQVQTTMPFSIDKDDDSLLSLLSVQQPRDDVKIFPKYHRITSNDDKHDLPFHEVYPFIDNREHKHFKQMHKDTTFKEQRDFKKELTGSSTRDLPIVLEYETPPPITASRVDYSVKNSEKVNYSAKNEDDITISDVVQPPPFESNPKVYGQWTSSKFASNVLNYLKNINFDTFKKPKKVSAISAVKWIDSYPYPSEFSYEKMRPPTNFKKIIHTKNYHNIKRRAVNKPEINVQIVKTNINEYLQLPPKYPDPNLVEVTNRGQANRQLKYKSYKNGDKKVTFESKEAIDVLPITFENRQRNTSLNMSERHRGNSLMDILPFLTSKDDTVKNQSDEMKSTETNQVYLKSLSNGNKWHNVKSYNNDYTPRLIKDLESLAKSAVKVANKRFPSFDNRGFNKQVQVNNAERIMDGRVLAKEVSNQANENHFPILKFQHGLLSVHDPKPTTSNNIAVRVVGNDENEKTYTQNNFNKHVKLGNALNEQFIIGFNEQLIKKTFLGGDDRIPDINKHRSEFCLDKCNSQSNKIAISSSNIIRVCKNVELYVQGDESIGKSKILSPLQRGNIAIEFIIHSYKKCSMNEMSSKDNSLLLIDWVKTPVKLFGGAYPKKTKDLCGFF